MGTTESKEKFDKLNDMKKLEDRGNYQIWEKADKQYEYTLFTSQDSLFTAELNFAEEINKQGFEGIVGIECMQLTKTDKWYAQVNCLHILTNHPKYTLNEYLKRVKAQLGNQQIIDLVLQIAGAQAIFGAKAQYIGFNNIYTNDGKVWKLKPFEETQSFYPVYMENRVKVGISFEMPGFPAPEEFKNQAVDRDRVSIFGFGMILLQLILRQYKSQDLYTKNGIDEQNLQQRINYLKQQKQNFSGVFIEIIIDMLDTDLTRRPNYQFLVRKLRAPASKISTINVPKFSDIKEVEIKDWSNLFNQSNLKKSEEVNIISAISQIEDRINVGLSTVKSKLLASTTKKEITNLDGTTYVGELNDGKYQGEGKSITRYLGKITRKNGKVMYIGTFDKGCFEFGEYFFENPEQLHTNYSYENCKNIFKYAIKYEGYFKDNKRNGQGRLTLTNKEMYCGDFKDDQIDGQGAYLKMDQSHIFGSWVQGVMHSTPGFCNQLSQFPSAPQVPSVRVFEMSEPVKPVYPPSDLVSFNMNTQQSKIALSKISEIKSAIEVSINKQKMNFSKRQIQIEGNTLYYDKEKKLKKYQGDHKEGVMHGSGILYFQDGQTVQYEGDFENDQFHGFGTLKNEKPKVVTELDAKDLRDIHIQGWWTSYDGSFMRGKKTGEGRLSLTDGSTYFGLFEFDEINGVGYLTKPNKQDLYARWENGILKEVITGQV